MDHHPEVVWTTDRRRVEVTELRRWPDGLLQLVVLRKRGDAETVTDLVELTDAQIREMARVLGVL